MNAKPLLRYATLISVQFSRRTDRFTLSFLYVWATHRHIHAHTYKQQTVGWSATFSFWHFACNLRFIDSEVFPFNLSLFNNPIDANFYLPLLNTCRTGTGVAAGAVQMSFKLKAQAKFMLFHHQLDLIESWPAFCYCPSIKLYHIYLICMYMYMHMCLHICINIFL